MADFPKSSGDIGARRADDIAARLADKIAVKSKESLNVTPQADDSFFHLHPIERETLYYKMALWFGDLTRTSVESTDTAIRVIAKVLGRSISILPLYMLLAFIASCICLLMNQKFLHGKLGFEAGIFLVASFVSLVLSIASAASYTYLAISLRFKLKKIEEWAVRERKRAEDHNEGVADVEVR